MRSAAAAASGPSASAPTSPPAKIAKVRAHADVEHGTFDRAHAEYENRNIERQDQKRDQRAAAPQADGQRRPHGPDQAEDRRSQQERNDQDDEAVGAHVQKEREDRRGGGEREPGREPMRRGLGQHDELQRQRAEHQLLQAAVIMVGDEEAIQRQERREQRRDPDGAGRNTAEQAELRPDGEGKERHRNDEENNRHQGADTAPHRERKLAADKPEEHAYHSSSSGPGSWPASSMSAVIA